jgi:hypothetical protein
MPIHQYDCEACSNTFDQFVKDIDEIVSCPKCECQCSISFDWGKDSNAFVEFKAFMNDMIDWQDVHITSRKQLQEECDKRGLNARGLKDGYIDWTRSTRRRNVV